MWEESGAFRADAGSGREPFTISMPPPNATGQLHLGHAVMLALEDIFIRFQRMRGKEALWVPGTDHAAIATNAVMERMLQEEGTDKHKIGRDAFIRRLKEYIEKSRGTIRGQIRKMGASCDWSRERYTMDPSLNRCVNEVFVKMYNDGLIYRGYRIVNWCSHCHSTLSDDEVEYKEERETFTTIRYGPIAIGTVRPETKFGDTAVAVHPDDERYKAYVGKELEIETAIGKAVIRVIADPIVDPKFGTGAVKVTPAHDFTDFEMAQRHGLEVVQVIDENGRMMEKAGPFKGMTTRECREAMFARMKEKGILLKEEPYLHNVSVCYRCAHVVEPLPKLQWFIDVDKRVVPWGKIFGLLPRKMSLKEVMQDTVRSGKIRIIPERFGKTYFSWIDNLRDWCISRQIWWGHRVPVWYRGGDIYVGVVPPKGERWEQDPDTLDTWFSSALWTWSTLVDPKLAEDTSVSFEGLLKRSPDLQRFHPTQVMETGYDILFFWVARMILMTTYALHCIPFQTVYLHGLVRTREGKKMSKSDPTTCIDPLEIIPRHGADALRLSMIVGQSPGNDFRLYEEKIAGYRNFVNKLWNAARFVLLQCEKELFDPHAKCENAEMQKCGNGNISLADRALLSKLQTLIADVTRGLEEYRLSEVGERLYSFTWDFFCDWILELSKGQPNLPVLVHAMRTILTLLHPYAPFVTEELWKAFKPLDSARRQPDLLMLQSWPMPEMSLCDGGAETELQAVIGVTSAIRRIRFEHGIDVGNRLNVVVCTERFRDVIEAYARHLKRLAGVSSLEICRAVPKLTGVVSAFLSGVDVHVKVAGVVDAERLKEERDSLASYIRSLSERLGNGEFRRKAPPIVVRNEEERKHEAEEKLKKVEGMLAMLS
jgi:valyl-tRNA synthetase